MMKKAMLLILLLLFTACTMLACAKETGEDVVLLNPTTSDGTVNVELTPNDYDATAAPVKNARPSLKVVSTVAYAYEADGTPGLYGAVEFQNNGSADIIVTKAVFTFLAGQTKVEHEFVPVLGEYDVVEPGESSFVTLWLPNDTVAASTAATLEADITCEAAQTKRLNMDSANLFLADNYPKFTTLSGTLTNASSGECSFLMTYVGFYDDSENLLGVWYFTKNIRLNPGDSIDFVSRMEDLPINGLSKTAKSIKTSAFGFSG
jgi:predicted small secreted protein